MKIINFRNYRIIEAGTNTRFYAEVDVRHWLKTTTRTVGRELGAPWFFVDTGKWCPGFDVEALERSYKFSKPD